MTTSHITLPNNDKLSLIGTLATMINSGIPILETIDSLLEDSKGNQRRILEEVRTDLTQGKSLHVSFAKFPAVFDKVTVNIIKASEEAGTLDTVLKDLKSQIQKDIEFSDKIKSALTYPIIIFIVFLIVLLVILVVVIPKIATVFVQLKVELPLPTRILITLSDYITKSTIPFLAGTVVFIGAIVFLFKFRKKQLLGMLFTMPLISNLIKQIDITRFSRSMFLLLTSGITITSALDLTQDVVLRRDISKMITDAKEAILAGSKLSEALRAHRAIFSGIILKLVEAGEKTGTLDQSMQEISEYMDYQVTNTLKTLTTLLEPLMLVGVGLLVGGMMMSIIAPIYGLISTVGGR